MTKRNLLVAMMLVVSAAQPVLAQSPVNLMQKGCQQINRGDYSSAIETLTMAVRKDPADLEARRQLCNAYLGAGMSREAAQQLELISKVSPGNTGDLSSLAEAYAQMGDNRSAIAKYKQALSIDPMCSKATVGLIRTFMCSGDMTSARAICSNALKTSRDTTLRSQCSELLSTIKSRSYMVKTTANS